MTDTTTTEPKARRYTTGALPLAEAKNQIDRMEALLAHLQRNGALNATNRELCEEYKRLYQEEMFPHHGMARLDALEAAGRVLCDRENKRVCLVGKRHVQVYRLIPKQADFL